MRVARYPLNRDSTPLDLLVGVVTDETGNNGQRLSNPPVGPDNAPIDAVGLILVDPDGDPITFTDATALGIASTLSGRAAAGNPNSLFYTDGYYTVGDGGEGYYRQKAVIEADEVGQIVSSNGLRFALVANQEITLEQFGGKKNDPAAGALNDAALEALMTFGERITDVYYGSARDIRSFAGDYYFADPDGHDFKITRSWRGSGGVAIAGGALGTRFIGPVNWKFLRFHAYNTIGDIVEVPPTTAAAGFGIYDIEFLGNGGVFANFNNITEGYAIKMRTPVFVHNCRFLLFYNPIENNTSVTSGGATEGQASHWVTAYCSFEQNRNYGIFIDGGDSSTFTITHCNFIANGRGGIYDGSFLGGYMDGGSHFRDNGARTDYWNVVSQCHFAGNWYYVNETATQATSDAALRASNPDVNPLWTLVGPGAVHSNYPEFTTFPGTFQQGGPIVCNRTLNNRTVAIGFYGESGQPPFFFQAPNNVLPAMAANGVIGAGFVLEAGRITTTEETVLGRTRSAFASGANGVSHIVHNNAALAGGLYAATAFAQGYQANGEPCYLGGIGVRSSSSNPATAEGILALKTRLFGTVANELVDRVLVDGSNMTMRPDVTNVMDFGLTGFRWKKIWAFDAEFTNNVIVAGEAYGAGWNGSNQVPTKNDVYDVISTIVVGGISDGDKGDIVVSGGGLVWSLDTAVVDYANIQNATANTVIARAAGSSGVLGEVALAVSQLLGRGSTGNIAPITLGTGLAIVGTALRVSPAVQSVTSSATVTPTFTNDKVNVTAQAAAINFANPTGTAIDGHGIVIRLKDNGVARTITYGSQYRAIGVTLPTTTVANKTLYLGMIYNQTDIKWDVVSVAQEA